MYIFSGTMSEVVAEWQCVHRLVAPPHGSEVDMMGVDRSFTDGGGRAGKQLEAPSLIILVQWLIQHIYIYA